MSLSTYIHEELGCTVTVFAAAIGRDRGTLRNWWVKSDPLLWFAVAGCKALNTDPGRVTPRNPCIAGEKGEQPRREEQQDDV